MEKDERKEIIKEGFCLDFKGVRKHLSIKEIAQVFGDCMDDIELESLVGEIRKLILKDI